MSFRYTPTKRPEKIIHFARIDFDAITQIIYEQFIHSVQTNVAIRNIKYYVL